MESAINVSDAQKNGCLVEKPIRTGKHCALKM